MKFYILYFIFLGNIFLFGTEKPINPLPTADSFKNFQKAELGKLLFFEPKISKNGDVSCATCHKKEFGGADNVKVSLGIGCLNSPSIYNLKYFIALNWNGKKKNIHEHTPAPLKAFLGATLADVVIYVKKDINLSNKFEEVYGVISEENILDSLVIYLENLTTPNSRFDKFLNGNLSIIDEKEKKGYRKFVDFGCASCHNGILVGGNAFMPIGVFTNPNEFFDANCTMGVYDFTQKEEHKFIFRVPSLRNVTKTSPYFHDGSMETLDDAISFMATFQLGIELKEEDIEELKAFFKTLEAEPIDD